VRGRRQGDRAPQTPSETYHSLAAVLGDGYPIFRNVARALRNPSATSHAPMTLGIAGAIAIGQYAAAVILFFMRLPDFIEDCATERAR
jgi:cation transport ATPase